MNEEFTYEEMVKANFTKFGEIYPAISGVKGTLPLPLKRRKRTFVYEGEAICLLCMLRLFLVQIVISIH